MLELGNDSLAKKLVIETIIIGDPKTFWHYETPDDRSW